jgi:hypothetical protein
MKIKLLVCCVGLALFAGCAANQQPPAIVAPAQVGADIQTVATIARPYLTASEVGDISVIKTGVAAFANGTLPVAQLQALIAAKLPSKDAPALSIALGAASAVFAEVYTTYGLGNTVFDTYCTDFVNGLTNAGY